MGLYHISKTKMDKDSSGCQVYLGAYGHVGIDNIVISAQHDENITLDILRDSTTY